MKRLFTFLMIAMALMSAAAAPMWICGKSYSQSNAQSINQTLTDDGYLKSGTVTYDASNNKLTLNNVNILADKTIIMPHEIETLEIEVIGNCTLKTLNENSTSLDNSISCLEVKRWTDHPIAINFTGSGSLKMTSTNIAVFACYRSSLAYQFNGPDVSVNANRGIYSTDIYGISYEMNQGSLEATGTIAAIYHFFNQSAGEYGTMNFHNGMKILEPSNAMWYCDLSNVGGAFVAEHVVSGYRMVKHVKIGTKYGLWVGGTQVTTQNCGDILGDGKVNYDQSANRLTLNNATVNAEAQVIVGYIAGLNIRLIGDNRLISQRNVYGLCLEESDGVVIDGGGTLTLSSAVDQLSICFFTHQRNTVKATIRNCSITLPRGIIQNEDNNVALTIDNSYIYTKDGYISTLPSLELINCRIAKPVGGMVSDVGQVVASTGGGMYWGEIEIVPVIAGDVNGDGEITVGDVSAIYDIILGLD